MIDHTAILAQVLELSNYPYMTDLTHAQSSSTISLGTAENDGFPFILQTQNQFQFICKTKLDRYKDSPCRFPGVAMNLRHTAFNWKQ